MNQVKFGISQSVLRMEDDPLLRGAGHYTSDHMPAGSNGSRPSSDRQSWRRYIPPAARARRAEN
jgi:hypothetical protein